MEVELTDGSFFPSNAAREHVNASRVENGIPVGEPTPVIFRSTILAMAAQGPASRALVSVPKTPRASCFRPLFAAGGPIGCFATEGRGSMWHLR